MDVDADADADGTGTGTEDGDMDEEDNGISMRIKASVTTGAIGGDGDSEEDKSSDREDGAGAREEFHSAAMMDFSQILEAAEEVNHRYQGGAGGGHEPLVTATGPKLQRQVEKKRPRR